jgi:protein-S-isoprenylcysteine O-methyltransferase Ste14
MTQPSLSIADLRKQNQNDRFSAVAILGGFLLTQIFSVIEWAYYRKTYHEFSFDLMTGIGLFLIIGGTLFRVWSIRSLGKYFTAAVQTQENQKIITNGAYKLIRHPSYSGAYIAFIGSSVLLHANIGIIVSAIVMLTAYWYRIKVEEETLVRKFGDEYGNYQKQTKKLLPFVY